MLLKYRENSNRIRTHNHLVRTQTLNHLAKLALRNTYKGFDCSMKMRSSFFTENQLFHMQYFWGDHPKNYPNSLMTSRLFFLKQITCMEIVNKEYLKTEKYFLITINIF